MIGCGGEAEPRVVRIAQNANAPTWCLNVNGHGQGDDLSSRTLTNRLAQLLLRQGDCILLDLLPGRESVANRQTEQWVSGYCQANRVAVYLTHAFAGVDMFSVRAYHWTAPYENPLDLTRASFFCEGKLLGRSTIGFGAMLRQIAQDRPRQVFILGSMYDFNRSFPPNPSPFEGVSARLDGTLKAAGTDFVRLDALPGF